jgi:hypothetical protein
MDPSIFYDALYKSLDDVDDDDNKCLITDMPLLDDYITLDCNHKFNYNSIYTEAYKQKTKNNAIEIVNKSDYFKCPYCRKVQEKLLPFVDTIETPLVYGINTLDIAYDTTSTVATDKGKHGKCAYTWENLITDEVVLCSNTYVTLLKEDNKCYCYSHKYLVLKGINKNAKMVLKAEQKKEKDELKLKAHAEKMKINNPCEQLLKSGPNKGAACGCRMYKDNLCMRHFNLQHKNIC